MKKIFTFLVVLVSTLSVFAADFKSDNLWYTITGTSTVEVAKHSDHKSLVSVTVPKTVSDGSKVYTVTEIGEEAFAECHTLTTVVLPEGVIELGGNAFEACENLVSVSLPEGLQTIGMNAFLSCDHLASVVIPNSVTSVGINAFNGCSALKSVELSENLQEIESGLFNACEALDYIVIPSSVSSIGKNAFYGCVGLDSIKCLGVTPATLANKTNVFKYVGDTIPVYVPCIAGGVSSVDAYNATSWASYFNKIQEPRPIYSVALSVNNDVMGTAKIGTRNTECGVDIVAVPNTGYEFVEWADGNKLSTRTLVLESDSAMQAIFKPIRYTITAVSADVAHGKAQGAEGDYNTEVEISATPKFGYRFNYWNDGNQDNPRQVLVLGEETYTAYFKEALVTVTKTASVCDNTTYVDPIKGEAHEIKSDTPASLRWNDSVWGALDQKDTLYTFVVTPLVAPKALTQATLDSIKGAVPVLVPGYEPDTTASVAAIWNYYKANDDEKTADVVSVKWNYSGKVKCDDTSFAMALIVKDTCGNVLNTACDFVVEPNIVADTVVEESCGEYTWGVTGLTYDKSGIYTHTVKSAVGCDSVYHVLDLKVWGPDTTVINDTVCYGTVVNGEKLTEDKVIEEPSGKTIHGCDSMTVYEFIVLPAIPVDTTKVTICAGESYTWEEGDGETYTTKQSIFVTKKTINGCDSILALELTVLPPLPDSIIRYTLCYGETYTWTKVGKEYTGAGELIKDSSTYEVGDCQGKLYLELTCWPEVVNVVTDTTICCGDSIKWNGRIYKEEGIYHLDTTDIHGCDSLATLDLKVLSKIAPTIIDTTICAGDYYYWELTKQDYKETTRDTVVLEHGIYKCDSMVVLNLTVLPEIPVTVIDTTICSGDTYDFYGTIYDKPTRVSYQDKSVVSGCDSVVILDLKYHPAIADTVTVITLCAGEHFTWTANDSTYTASAQEKVILESIHGCDSVAILDLTILDTIPTTFRYDTICYGDTLLWEEAGKQFTESSIVQDTLTSISGCDSVVVLNLTVLSKIEPTIIDTTICAGGEYYWKLTQETYKSTTTDSVVLPHGKYGCDSLVVLNLTVLPEIPVTVIDTTICSGDTYDFYGTIYDKPTRVSYQDKSVVSGCDSVVILDLKYHPAIADTVTVITLCAGEHFTWTANDSTYTASAQEKVILESIHGCDSVAILDLTILDTISTTFRYDTICYGDTLLWEEAGKQLTESSIVQDTLTSISGCDSVVVLNLTVLSKIEPTIIDTTICAGDYYYWELTKQDYKETTRDTVVLEHGIHKCDSMVVLNLTVLPEIPVTVIDTTICSGDTYDFYGTIYDKPTRVSYQDKSVVSGCDSVVILDLKYHPAIADTVTVVTLCAGEHFTWTANDSTYTASAQEKVILESIHGCDSVAILDLTILDTIPTTFRYDTICYGDTLLWEEAGKQFTESSIVQDTLTSITGCDSVVVLNLTILPKIDTTFIDAAICHGKYYYWSATETQYFESFSDTVVLSSTKYGCDSVVALNLHVWPLIKDTTVNDTICYGDFYVFDGDTLREDVTNRTGKFPSINGCDSIVTLNLTVLDPIPVTHETAYICFGKEPYFWEAKNKTYYSATTDTVVLPSVLTGCDSTVVLTVIAVEELKSTVTDTICFGDSIEWGGSYYKKNGLYNMTLQSAISGCDSIVTLNLTVLDEIKPVVTEDTICACNAPYIWRNQVLTESGVYNDIVKTKYGCDSIYTLNLHVWPLIKDTIVNETICYGDFYVFGGDTLKGNSDITKTLPSVNGCDSIVHLQLTVLEAIPVTYETAYICYGKEPYYWEAKNKNYYSATTDTVVLPSVLTGCDSTVVLTLIEVPELKSTVDTTICFGDSIEWGGCYYKKTGQYDMHLQSAISGCDSVVTLHLTVLDKIEPVVTEDTICACKAPYIWRNKALRETGVYNDTVVTEHGCDSIYTLKLHVWPLIKDTIVNETICYGDFYVFGGDTLKGNSDITKTLPSVNGCDSIVHLQLTVLEAIPVTYETAYICYGKEPYYWEAKNKTYNSATTDTVVLPSILTGCDSMVVLTIKEVEQLKSTVDTTICFGDSIEWGGKYYKKDGQYDMHLQSAISGCDSIVTLNLTIRPMIEPTYTPDTICSGDAYIWNGQTYNATGEYSYTHTSIHGCDSVEILQLFVRPVVETVTYAEICSGDVYRWEGENYTSSTNKSITHTSKITGCDSIVTLHLIVHNEIPVTVLDTAICYGTSINWLGTSYANDTIVTDTLICKHGCDSIVMLKLHIRDSIHTVVYDTICHDGTYEWNGRIYTDSITDQITLTDIYGCDSIVTLHLTVLDSILPTEDTQVACDSYEWHGDIYTASGDYTKTLTTRHGCDSVVTLHLTVKYSSYTDTAAVECDSFYWHNTGETYTESGDYTYTTVAANGCDSIVTLHLTIKKSTVGEAEQLIICYGDSIEWNGQVYKVEGDYSTILESANAVGCDSTAKMHLTILPDVQYEYYKATICANETHDWFNRQLSKAGTYYDTIYNIRECDSIIHVLDLTVLPIDTNKISVTACDSYTWNGETYTVSGEYHHTTSSLVDGCDSVTILFLTITPTIYKDTTVVACISYEWNGVVYKQSGDYTNTLTAASGCDSVVTMHLTINQPTVGDPRKEYICYGESYEWHGTTYSESGYYSIILENAVGCDSTAYLDLTVLPEMKYKYHTLYVCAGDLPYEWNNLSLTESGEYTYREQFAANASCDSIEHVLTFTVYDMSLPDTISQPIAICGKPIDLMKATDQIESYIASISHYAPNATVVWQEWIDGVWVDYDYETLKGSQSEIIIRYAIITDCGVIYSDEMVLVVEQATPENSTELDNMSVESKYGNRIFLFDLNAFSSTFGWTPTPEQVSWYKVVGEVDVYGEMGDDELVGVGHSYNLPEGEVMVGGYYAIVEQHAVSVDDCETIYRSTVIYATASGIAPKLVPNVVYPDEVLTIKNLDASQIHQILVYGASGELIATYKADKVGEFMFNAANATGYYLVDIINTNGSTTLRYVVK